jgi:hypothetical protein
LVRRVAPVVQNPHVFRVISVDRSTVIESAAAVRAQARTLRDAGWLDAAIDLLDGAAAGAFRGDVGVRIDLVRALLEAGRIEEAEAVRLPETRA